MCILECQWRPFAACITNLLYKDQMLNYLCEGSELDSLMIEQPKRKSLLPSSNTLTTAWKPSIIVKCVWRPSKQRSVFIDDHIHVSIHWNLQLSFLDFEIDAIDRGNSQQWHKSAQRMININLIGTKRVPTFIFMELNH